jgi:DNA polymerase-1
MLSQDQNLMNVFLSGRDVHIETAMMITGLPEDKITTVLRKKAKTVNFGYLYGMGWRGFKKYAKQKYDVEFTDEESEAARDGFFERYPGLLLWHERQRQLVRRRHQVRSPLGRIRHLPDILSVDKEVRAEAERQAINSPCQSMPPDICVLSMALLMPEMDWGQIRVVGMVHDCLLFECRDDIIEQWVPRIKQTMENLPLEKLFGFKPSIPITVDIKVSKYWEGEE